MDVVEEAPSNYWTFEAQQHEDAQFLSSLGKLYRESQDAFDNHKGKINEIFEQLDNNICNDNIEEVLSLPTDYIPSPGAAATSSNIPPPHSDENSGETPKADGLDNPYVRVDEYWSRPRAEQARSFLTLRWPNDLGEPMVESRQSRSLSAERSESYGPNVRASPGNTKQEKYRPRVFNT